MFWGEITNPCYILMKKYRVEADDKKASLCQYLFVLLYLPARGYFIPKLTVQVQSDPQAIHIFKILFGFAYFISVVWLYMIINLAAKEFAKVRINFLLVDESENVWWIL